MNSNSSRWRLHYRIDENLGATAGEDNVANKIDEEIELRQMGEEEWCRNVVSMSSKDDDYDDDLRHSNDSDSISEAYQVKYKSSASSTTDLSSASSNLSKGPRNKTGALESELSNVKLRDSDEEDDRNPRDFDCDYDDYDDDYVGAAAAAADDGGCDYNRDEVGFYVYLKELLLHLNKPETMRGKQCRLTLWEILEHFSFLNDLFFICKVGACINHPSVLEYPSLHRLGCVSVVYLICIWLTSAVAYGVRSETIYHRISNEDKSIFYPVYVFYKIKRAESKNLSILYMFERLSWTHQVIARIFEDIPQLIVSVVFLANFGRNFYTYFMIVYSCTLMLVTSIKMGISFPIVGTLSLVLSRSPPVDSPVLSEAAPTTMNFVLFVAFNFCLWFIANIVCLCFVEGFATIVFSFLAATSIMLTVFFVVYWIHLHIRYQSPPPHQQQQPCFDDQEPFIRRSTPCASIADHPSTPNSPHNTPISYRITPNSFRVAPYISVPSTTTTLSTASKDSQRAL